MRCDLLEKVSSEKESKVYLRSSQEILLEHSKQLSFTAPIPTVRGGKNIQEQYNYSLERHLRMSTKGGLC